MGETTKRDRSTYISTTSSKRSLAPLFRRGLSSHMPAATAVQLFPRPSGFCVTEMSINVPSSMNCLVSSEPGFPILPAKISSKFPGYPASSSVEWTETPAMTQTPTRVLPLLMAPKAQSWEPSRSMPPRPRVYPWMWTTIRRV
jgi:hypothetical protein